MINIKKRILVLVSILTLITTVNVYANELIPTNVIRNDLANGVKEIVKVYEIERSDELVVDIDNFSEGELEYEYVTTTSNEIVETDEKELVKTVTKETSSNNRDNILSQYNSTIEHTTDDGYYGILSLDSETLNTEVKGYKTKQYQVHENRTYPNLPTNDVAFIPKSINADGHTYTMSNVSWAYNSNFAENSVVPETYTASVTYERTASSKNPTGYISTAKYRGVATKTIKDVVQYEVVFRTSEIQEVEEVEETVIEDEISDTETKETESNLTGFKVLKLILIILFVILIIVAIVIIYIKFIHARVVNKLSDVKMKKQIRKNMMNEVELQESVDEYFNNLDNTEQEEERENPYD